jgi:hypothetical protein
VIDTLIAAVRAGELDELFNQAAKTGSIGKAEGCLIIRAGRWMKPVARPQFSDPAHPGRHGTQMSASGVSQVASSPSSRTSKILTWLSIPAELS